MITSGVATRSAASNDIAVVIMIPPSSPAASPAKIAFVLVIAASMSCRGVRRGERLFIRFYLNTNAATINSPARWENFPCPINYHG